MTARASLSRSLERLDGGHEKIHDGAAHFLEVAERWL
jgi:hypothetical protein